ncbi:Rv2175c family DNA-binding protein [Kocuria sp.]|uniref:Rv2175c family DNA-binding protein n=1 Tax=Kocuria sp. TaxID=1871328 RepID=UPI0026DFA3A0|nr:Rv2175c family DNA-binding protein [Kocuria sp.]MDO5366470.1 Rv2175c family DNA-binding protein [Kocuria sp.]
MSVNHSSEISAETFAELDSLVGEWTYLPDIAQALDIQITKVHRMMDQGEFLEVRRPSDGVRVVPAEFMADGQPLNALKGTISVLRDARYTDEEAIRWLFTDDESLPGRPVDALREGRKTEVRRRAQALGW